MAVNTQVQRFLAAYMKGTDGVTYTPGGLAWASAWGSLRFVTNAAMIAVTYSKQIQGAGRCASSLGMAFRGACLHCCFLGYYPLCAQCVELESASCGNMMYMLHREMWTLAVLTLQLAAAAASVSRNPN